MALSILMKSDLHFELPFLLYPLISHLLKRVLMAFTITLTIIGTVFANDWMRFSNFIEDNIVYG